MLRLINIRATDELLLDCFPTDLGFRWHNWGVFMGRSKKLAHDAAITEMPSIQSSLQAAM